MNKCKDKPYKIALLLSCLKFGGAERVALNLAHALRAQGIAIDIVLMAKEGEFLTEAEESFRVVDLACNKTYKLPAKLLMYVFAEKPRFIISSFWKLNLCACVVRACWPTFGLALWEHSSPYQTDKIDKWYYFVVSNTFYHISSRIIAVSHGVYDLIVRNTVGLKHKVVCLANPIPPPAQIFLTAAQRRHSCWLERQSTRILFVGRLASEKNPLLLLDAFMELSFNRDITLTFVGDGPLRKELEKSITEHQLSDVVRCVGFQSEPYRYIAEADILALPSNREGLPSVLIEALYCGCSIVATDSGGGVREILEGGRYGTIVPVGDKEAFANGILKEISNKRRFNEQTSGGIPFLPENVAKLYYDHVFKFLR